MACQRFFRSRYASGWFEVASPSQPQRAQGRPSPGSVEPSAEGATGRRRRSAPVDSAARQHVDTAVQRYKRQVGMRNEPRVYAKALGSTSLAATSPWLERTRWLETYKDVRRDILKAMTTSAGSKPWTDLKLGQGEREGDADIISSSHDEQKIACLLNAVDLMINRCETTARHTGRLIRCWLVSSRPDYFQSRAFSVMTEPGTQRQYRTRWKKFIAFVIRACLLPESVRQQVKVAIPPDVRRQVHSLWEHKAWGDIDITRGKWPKVATHEADMVSVSEGIAHRLEPLDLVYPVEVHGRIEEGEEDEQSDESDESEWGDESEVESDWEPDGPEDEQTQASHGGEHGSQLVAEDPLQAAHAREALELLFQLSFTLCKQQFVDGDPGSTLLVYFSGICGFTSDYQHFMRARQFCPSLSGLIYVQRLLFLEYSLPLSEYSLLGLRQRPRIGQLEHFRETCDRYITAGSPTALAELFSLRNFGYKVARTEPPTRMLHWSEDGNTVCCGLNFTLSMDQFKQLPEYFISQAEKLCADLLYGLESNVVLADLRDDMTNSKLGYSFVSHPSNGLDGGYARLLLRACLPHGSLSALSGSGGWSWYAVRQYLKLTRNLEEMLFGGFYTSCGQCPRLRELASLECENSPIGSRGIYVWNGSVIYLIRHHKAKRSTNHEFNVVRFLPARLGVVTVRYLSYIRRVASILRRELDEHMRTLQPATDTTFLFQNQERQWSTQRMTSILKAATCQVWPSAATCQLYRQVTVGITEKHVREVFTPFNRYDDRGLTADKNAVFAWQSGHRPEERGRTYGLDGAYPHQLQPSLLRAYEWASTRWHEFICQASKVARQEKSGPFCSSLRIESAETTCSSIDPCITPIPKLQSALRSTQLSEGNANSIACILSRHQILVCLLCKAGVRPGEKVESHFRSQHRCKGDQLKAILRLAGQSLLDPSHIPLPADGSAPIPELLVRPGYRCRLCSAYLTISKDAISTHCRTYHQLVSGQGNWEAVYLQTFMTGSNTQYWVVRN